MAWMRNALGSRVTGVKVGVLRPGNWAQEICGGNNLEVKGGGGLGICCHRFFFRPSQKSCFSLPSVCKWCECWHLSLGQHGSSRTTS